MEYPALCLAWISSFCCLVNFANRNTPNNSGVQIIGGTSEQSVALCLSAFGMVSKGQQFTRKYFHERVASV